MIRKTYKNDFVNQIIEDKVRNNITRINAIQGQNSFFTLPIFNNTDLTELFRIQIIDPD